MFEWLRDANQNYVTVATALIALVLTVVVARYAMIPYHAAKREKRVLDTRTWDGILGGLQTDRAARYFGAIQASLGWFDRVYGPRLISYRAFDRALLFAFGYAIFTLLIGWVLFDAGHLGGVVFLPEGRPLWWRMFILVGITVTGGLVLSVFCYEKPIKTAITVLLTTPKESATRQTVPMHKLKRVILLWDAEVVYLLIVICALAVATAVSISFSFSVSAVGGSAGAMSVAFAVFVAIAFTGIGFFAVAVSVAGLAAIVAFLAEFRTLDFHRLKFDLSTLNTEALLTLATMFLFFAVLPMLNAVADFLSIAATRSFLRRIAARRKTAVQVLTGVGIDLVIAALCLGLLLGSIIQTLDLWRDLSPATLPFDWRAYRDTLCAGDWQRGTMLWLMLSTTLAPTALHLAAGFGAVFAHSAQIDSKVAAILQPARDALVTKHKAKAFDSDHEARAKSVLTADQRQTLEDLLGQKEGAQRWLSVALFIIFMLLMMAAVILAAHQFALPQLCPSFDPGA